VPGFILDTGEQVTIFSHKAFYFRIYPGTWQIQNSSFNRWTLIRCEREEHAVDKALPPEKNNDRTRCIALW